MIKSGREIMGTANSHLHAQIKAIDDQNAEILAVIKPIAATPAYYISDADWNKFFALVAELEALKEAHGKDTAD